jgi:hypothetical protein
MEMLKSTPQGSQTMKLSHIYIQLIQSSDGKPVVKLKNIRN